MTEESFEEKVLTSLSQIVDQLKDISSKTNVSFNNIQAIRALVDESAFRQEELLKIANSLQEASITLITVTAKILEILQE